MLLGGLGVLGWLWVAVTLAMAAPFLRNTDFTSWLVFRGHLETTRGTVLGCRSTGASEGGGQGHRGTPVFANRYRFAWNGVEHEGVSYATGEFLDADAEVAVEQLPGHPALDSTGNFVPGAALGTILVLLPPLLACTVLAMVIGF